MVPPNSKPAGASMLAARCVDDGSGVKRLGRHELELKLLNGDYIGDCKGQL